MSRDLLFAVPRNREANLRTLSRLTCHLNVPAVSAREVLRDRLERVIYLLRFHAGAAITHFHGNFLNAGISSCQS
jgi:hypothetical protein